MITLMHFFLFLQDQEKTMRQKRRKQYCAVMPPYTPYQLIEMLLHSDLTADLCKRKLRRSEDHFEAE